jgi:hypothetical protein
MDRSQAINREPCSNGSGGGIIGVLVSESSRMEPGEKEDYRGIEVHHPTKS